MSEIPTVDYSITFEDPIDQLIYARAKNIISVICPHAPLGFSFNYNTIVSEILDYLKQFSQFEVTRDKVEQVVTTMYNEGWRTFIEEVKQDNFFFGQTTES